MINEECLARPTWEMAHLQTQVRRGGIQGISLRAAGSFSQAWGCLAAGKVLRISHRMFQEALKSVTLAVLFLRYSGWKCSQS